MNTHSRIWNIKANLIPILCSICLFACGTKEIMPENQYPYYNGNDLGVNYTPNSTKFRIWAPTAEEVLLKFYDNGTDGSPVDSVHLAKDIQGTWFKDLPGDHIGKFYTFRIKNKRKWLNETPGPYAKATGVNGKRGFIANLVETNPPGWEGINLPPVGEPNSNIIYEIHIRDISISENSGIKNKGKYLGLTESGTVNSFGEKTGLDHIVELGVDYIHILPMFDFRSIDETKLENNDYNWGYDPQNYNVPEGSYATDPYDPLSRIKEMKQMIQALHNAGIRVVMDVVYNHTGEVENHAFNLTVPGYYYRTDTAGSLSDASACGNETASEKPMMRKYIVESLKYWTEEYKIDGFRVDLMGIHDIETMNLAYSELKKLNPDILVYGEGWKAGPSPLADSVLALKKNVPELTNIAAFSDEIRDGLKGSWHDWEAPGFINGNHERKDGVMFGIVGGTNHPQLDFEMIPESTEPWSPSPNQCMVYVSCHDNHTLFDKLNIVDPGASSSEILKKHIMANTVVLTSNGNPFLHSGVEFVRTKQGVENSYESPDSINQIDWDRKHKFLEVNKFYQDLIQLRKDHPAFRLNSAEQIANRVKFYDYYSSEAVIYYTIDAKDIPNESWTEVIIIHNAENTEKGFRIPEDYTWISVLEGMKINEKGIQRHENRIEVKANTSVILVKEG